MSETNKTTWAIGGMHCPSCVELVKSELSSLPEVDNVTVTLKPPRAVLSGSAIPDRAAADKALAAYGYRITDGEIPGAGAAVPADRSKEAGRWALAVLLAGVILLAFHLLQKSGLIPASGILGAGGGGGILFALGMGVAASFSSCLAIVGSLVISFSLLWQPDPGDRSLKGALKPNLLFHGGRIAAFTLLGGLLGLVGGSLTLTGPVLGTIQLVLAVLLGAMALTILGAGALFSRLGLRMPGPLFRLMQKLKGSRSPAAPIILGSLTFFLPCGFTQSQQIAALGSGSFRSGALILLAFSLGTLPVLLAAGLTAGWSARRRFTVVQRAAGLLVGVFAVTTLFAAIPLFGVSGNLLGDDKDPAAGNRTVQTADTAESQVIEMHVTYDGFDPPVLTVKKGIPVTWIIYGDELTGCTNAIIIPSLKIKVRLKPGKNVVTFTPEKSGTIPYSCWMGMVDGEIRVK
jgi:sulfite exporter TauE/SafE/copper chaperone CopZ